MQIDENTEQLKRKELLKQAYLKIQELQHRLEEKDRAGFGEPIAIIGMGCRFPGGVHDAETLWKMLKTGTDTVGDIPSDRWDLEEYFDPDPGKTGRMYSRHGAFLNTIDQFDPHFFGISPREAEKMDPQQRLLLEIAWEALESSGQISEALQGSNTGVFVALNGDDYAHLMSRAAGIEAIDLYFGTGVARSIAAGRISYTLGLKGPCISLDTACSGSLVAVHLACQSLRMQECRMAVAGGVTLIITPDGHLIGSKGQMLSPAGRCKTFDAAADGYVRGEGCGIVVLKRLAEAHKDKDCILAVIRGTAINQDGRSSGMTAPNGLAQEEVIRKALADGGIDPHEVGYVETHGTGTILGDPIEVLALGNTYGKSHSKTAPVIIGAVKTNIGHLEAAAGIAGLLKTVLILQHGEIPPSLHFKNPNPHIPWDKLSIHVARQNMAWPGDAGKRIAAVSSFGFSGTNAHVVLESTVQPAVETAHFERPLHILALSAKSDQALNRLGGCFIDYFEKNPDLAAGDVCFTSNTGRPQHGLRLVCIGSNLKELGQALSGRSKSGGSRLIKGPVKTIQAPPIAFLFTGQGSQYVNMGRRLYETQPVFRRTLAHCSQILKPWLPRPLSDLLYPQLDEIEPAQEIRNQTAFTQPALFSVEYAMHALLQSWGIQPSAVLGHGVGEYAAACIAGVFSLEAGLVLATERGKLMQAHTTEADFGRAAAGVTYNAPRIDIVSTVTGRPVDEKHLLDAGYWCRQVRSPLMLQESVQLLYREGYRLFVEIGPGKAGIEPPPDALWLPSLGQGADEWSLLLESLGQLYVHGAAVDWRGFDRDYGRARVPLPTYPFQRERYWFQTTGSGRKADPRDDGLHPLLGRQTGFAKSAAFVFESAIDGDRLSYLLEHRIFNTTPFPATAYLEMGQAAAVVIAGQGHHCIEDFMIHAPLMIDADACLTLQTVVEITAEHAAGIEIFSLNAGGSEVRRKWTLHASGRLQLNQDPSERGEANWELVRKQAVERCAEALSGSQFYDMLRLEGVDYGPAFQGLAEIRRGSNEALGRIHIPPGIAAECSSYHIHPAVLDACLQLMGAALLGREAKQNGAAIYLPMGLDRYSCNSQGLQDGWIHAAIRSGAGTDTETFSGDVRVFTAAGRPIAHLTGLRFKQAAGETLRRLGQDDIARWLYELKWQALQNPIEGPQSQITAKKWLIVSDQRPMAQALAACLKKMNREAVCLSCTQAELTQNADGGPEGIIYLCGSDMDSSEAAAPAWEEHPERECICVLNLVQAMAGAAWADPPRLILVTCGAAAVGEGEEAGHLQPNQAALWGLGRVIAAEHSEFRCKLVDLDPLAILEDKIHSLAVEVVQRDCRENQVAMRQGQRFALRLVRSRHKSKTHATKTGVPAGPYQLEISSRGVIDNLEFHPFTPLPPGPGEVQIQVEATGLNFRDVLNVLGMYPGNPGALGNECVGRIALLGPAVEDFVIGQPVLALAPQAFCSHVNVRCELVAPRPDSISMEEAATIPMTFLTAQYALHYLGHMQPGERVLIHAGAGGVGMAAIQLARQAGAEIFATAGSEEKRVLLKRLGVQHVMDSRTLAFSDQIAEETANQGIDIVLNSLAGEFIPRSLSLLRAGGRFLELGKTDLWDKDRAARVNSAATFIPVYLGDICRQQPALVKSMFQDLMQGFLDGHLKPLPHRIFPIHDVRSAFRFMAQAKHIGKVVLDQRSAEFDHPVRDNATYLITGGLGALGLHFARWLADKGALHLVLLGRRPANEAAQEVIDQLKSAGVCVTIAQGDVSKKRDLQRVFDELAAQPPLRGIIHAAGLLDDGMLRNLNRERFISVMAPKIGGSWQLHLVTQHMDLDFFVMCSAGAALFGSPGQANYAAANAFMDALAHYRRSIGLPALSINWGPWSNGGMANALSVHDRRRWKAQGMGMIEAPQGTKALELALDLDVPQLAVLPMSWPVFFQKFSPGEEPPLLSAIAGSERSRAFDRSVAAPTNEPDDVLKRLSIADPESRRDLLMDYLRDQAVGVLGLRPSVELNVDDGLTDMGMDSLMAVEFSNRLKRALGRHLPSTLAFEHPTLRALADYLAQDILELETGGKKDGVAQVPSGARKAMLEVADLSESDAEQDLLQELDRSGY